MADSDLEAIRRARLQQLQSQGGTRGAGGGENAEADDDQKAREADARASILSQILEPAAADRLGRIRMVNGSRAESVENRLIMLARSGQLRSRVTDEQLKELLNAANEQQKEADKVTVQRRKGGWDDDDLDDLLNED